jgi:serine/threonine-protein kinase
MNVDARLEAPPASARFSGPALARGAAIGRYLVLSLLGRGGMGEVYAAYDPELDRRVAIKLLHLARGTAAARERLVREARALGKLSHPNVVQVHDVGEHQGDVFVAMELIEGEPFDAWCAGAGKPAFSQILAAYRDAARGLAAAHEKGIVHRDVKPSNLLLGKDGRVRVLDFGIAADGDAAQDDPRPGSSPAAEEIRPRIELGGAEAAPSRAPGGKSLSEAATSRAPGGKGLSEAATSRAPGGKGFSEAATSRAPGGKGLSESAPSRASGGKGFSEAGFGSQNKDFSLDATVPIAATPSGASPGRLTETGTLMGTPLYLAPEQYENKRASPASDQYSLCLSLHEGLYGELPFAAKPGVPLATMLAELYALKKRGPPASPPAGSTVPAWVYDVVARGLAPEPEDRYPSMEALAEALSDDPEARHRTALRHMAIAGGVMALVAIAVLGWVKSGAFRNPCEHPERELAGVWDEGVKGRVRTAFLATGRTYAEDTAARVSALLDRHAAALSAMRGQVCEAGRGAEGMREVLELRDACLDRRRGQLAALTALLAEKADPQVLDGAVQAAAGLSPVDYCADTEALLARVRPPEDPAVRARVAALQPLVDRSEALFRAGKFKEGLAVSEPLSSDPTVTSYAPLRAQVQFWTGQLRDGAGDYEGAAAALRGALASAGEGKDDLLAAYAWSRLYSVVGHGQRRYEEAAILRSLATGAIARAQDDRATIAWLNAEGTVLNSMSKGAEAKASLEKALPLLERSVGPDHPDMAHALNNLGNSYLGLGDFAKAREHYSRALAIWEKTLGPEHPRVGAAVGNLGVLLDTIGDYAGAKAYAERSLAIFEKALGPDHHYTGAAMNNVATVLFHMGDFAGARARFERALAIESAKLDPEHPHVADSRTWLGRTEIRLGHLDAAEAQLSQALAALEKKADNARRGLSLALLGMGELWLARGQPDKAVPLIERSLSIVDPGDEAEIQLALAGALWPSEKERPRARDLAEKARAGFERLGNAAERARADRWLADHPAP